MSRADCRRHCLPSSLLCSQLHETAQGHQSFGYSDFDSLETATDTPKILGKGHMSLFQVLRRLSDDTELVNFLAKEKNSEWALSKKLGKIQTCLTVLLQKRADSLMDYAYMIK